jgi:hypothetical protein
VAAKTVLYFDALEVPQFAKIKLGPTISTRLGVTYIIHDAIKTLLGAHTV